MVSHTGHGCHPCAPRSSPPWATTPRTLRHTERSGQPPTDKTRFLPVPNALGWGLRNEKVRLALPEAGTPPVHQCLQNAEEMHFSPRPVGRRTVFKTMSSPTFTNKDQSTSSSTICLSAETPVLRLALTDSYPTRESMPPVNMQTS